MPGNCRAWFVVEAGSCLRAQTNLLPNGYAIALFRPLSGRGIELSLGINMQVVQRSCKGVRNGKQTVALLQEVPKRHNVHPQSHLCTR